jgi:hypothetical protein
MRRFQPTLACPFSEETSHRNKPVARVRRRSRDSRAKRQANPTRMHRAPRRRQSFSLNSFCAPNTAAGLREEISQIAPNGAALCKRDLFRMRSDQQRVRRWRYPASLFLLPGTEARLPSCGLLAWRRGNCLDLFFLGFLDFPIAFLLALGHAALPEIADTDRMQRSLLTTRPDQPCATVRLLAPNSHVLVGSRWANPDIGGRA